MKGREMEIKLATLQNSGFLSGAEVCNICSDAGGGDMTDGPQD